MNDNIKIKRTQNTNIRDYSYGDFFYQIQDLKKEDGSPKLDEDSKAKLRRETGDIYSQLSFSGDTGMVVGKIQSGKTMSFEALSGLARDNDVPLIIILAGISKILTDQTFGRLCQDFDVKNNRHWNIQKTKISNPSLFEEINQDHKNWLDPKAPRKKAHIFVVMKNAAHIDQITEICSKLDQIENIKALIIDDESDQYSIDVSRKEADKASRVYSCIKNLRESIPQHSFVQYTATPAANMLVALNDILSPNFAYNIDPGDDYTELQSLFPFKGESPYIEQIQEVEADIDIDSVMPDQLKDALYLFLISVADGFENEDGENRSMLIHPSRIKLEHQRFYGWIKQEIELLMGALEDKQQGIEDSTYIAKRKLFEHAYKNLSSTAKNLKPLDVLLEKMVYDLREIKVELINSGPESTATVIEWEKNYAFIICSGQAVDRGTTVQGLTVTYMPRTAAGSQDTQIQRARFLGYRKDYKDHIRIYVDSDAKKFYKNYHVAESSIRELINEYTFKSFKEAVRQWKLVKGFDSCRKAAIKIGGEYKFKATGKFVAPFQPHNGKQRIEQNFQIINEFISKYDFKDMDEDSWFGTTAARSHSSITLPIREAYESLLSNIGFQDPKDARAWADLDLFMRHAYHQGGDNPDGNQEDFNVQIVLMGRSRYTTNQWEIRNRSEKPTCDEKGCRGRLVNLKCNICNHLHDDSIVNLSGILQGASQKGSDIYPGDREIYSHDPYTFTIQIHMLKVERRTGVEQENVPLIASRLPEEIWKRFDVQAAGKVEENKED